jgi:hypothetical protein
VSVSFSGAELKDAQNLGRNETVKFSKKKKKKRDGQEVRTVYCVQVQGGISFRQETQNSMSCVVNLCHFENPNCSGMGIPSRAWYVGGGVFAQQKKHSPPSYGTFQVPFFFLTKSDKRESFLL